VTQGPDIREFEEFQLGVRRVALVLWTVALVAALAASGGYSATVGGMVLGGFASLGAFSYKVWTLRRLAAQPTSREARRLPLVDGGRYLIMIAGLAPAAWLAVQYDVTYVFAAAAMLFLTNLATVIQAVRVSRSA
jgi:hypothetical protein